MRVTVIRSLEFERMLGEESGVYLRGIDDRQYWLLTEDRLIVGDVHPHATLLVLASTREGGKPETFRARYIETKARLAEFLREWDPKIVGGGTCDGKGQVISWETVTFKRDTPIEWRKAVQGILHKISGAVMPEEDPDITLS